MNMGNDARNGGVAREQVQKVFSENKEKIRQIESEDQILKEQLQEAQLSNNQVEVGRILMKRAELKTTKEGL